MGKLNVSTDERVREELFRLVPPRWRSQVVNEALRKELFRRKWQLATKTVQRFRKQTELCQLLGDMKKIPLFAQFIVQIVLF